MVVNLQNIERDVWDTIEGIIAADSATKVTGTLGVNYIGGTWPKKAITAGADLPYIIIHKPTVKEEFLTMKKKKYPVSMVIEVFSNDAAKLKDVSDGVRAALEANQSTTKAVYMYHYMASGDDEGVEIKEDKRIHTNKITCEWLFLGG